MFGVASFGGSVLEDAAVARPEGQALQVDEDTFYLNTGPTAASLVLDLLESTP